MPITCPHCEKHFPKSNHINSRHKAVCTGWQSELGDTKPRVCLCGHEEKSLTQMKRHRKVCEVWQSRDSRKVQAKRLEKTLQKKYGVSKVMDVPGVKGRVAQTNLNRYGAENVCARESSLYDKVQASLEGKRVFQIGENNPFSKPEVKEKIKNHFRTTYGVDNPMQVPEIQEKKKKTNKARYGVEEVLASSSVREQIRETCEVKYGGPAPSCSLEVQERARTTNQERFGVDWTCQDPEVRARQLETMQENYGNHFFASEEGKEIIRSSLLEKYGVDHPMKNPEIARKALETAKRPGPNLVERLFGAEIPELMYTGNGGFWRWLPKLGSHKNPDFILPGPVKTNPKKGVTKVVEVFGDYWHSRMFTGKAKFSHESELVCAFNDIGIDCMIVWESEIKKNLPLVTEKVRNWLNRCNQLTCQTKNNLKKS